jgi:SAM-dependent methyltransferase
VGWKYHVRKIRPACRTCESSNTVSLGSLPDVSEFAGVPVTPPLPGGELWRCVECSFVFRHPVQRDDEYEKLYAGGSAELWDVQQQREDFRLIREQVSEWPDVEDVLDVGCYTGGLLTSLPRKYRLYGVELNREAAHVARSRGVNMIAQRVSELEDCEQQFDVITACDVIEHVANPVSLLKNLRSRLRTGGRLLISTGDSDAWLWRLTRSTFWYCYFPEHISFLGRRWWQSMAGNAGLRVERAIRFNYAYRSLDPMQLRPMLGAMGYWLSPTMYRRVQRRFKRMQAGTFAAPGCGASRDHLLCVLTRS